MTKKMRLTVLDPNDPEQKFPSISQALSVPDGLLAVGGCLSKNRLLNAYRQGIFPWNSPDEPILWWSPDPRLVLFPGNLSISRSLAKTLRKQKFTVTVDRVFDQVVMACAQPRKEDAGTWITNGIFQAFYGLHRSGDAHSIEVWLKGELVGGLYGLAIGQVFFGESMFHTETDASKVAFVSLVERLNGWDYKLVDCQVTTRHLMNFGAEEIPRIEFAALLERYCDQLPDAMAWQDK
ncbi:leucyl/phenylalanyl-tRNA--protein transferase Aat [Methyloglobulus morosus KoM1]|uniref:Leucyl/phenylalanyl-tRNA--protein transferase n=2 Tax=Methyloglobulus TaxID=1410680 RepID=V5DPE7_9GAMM|nr:leucyl/phenylalanyl-tRNA--protein transferase Aat [Methyloglobulus morosus KoM1]